MKAKFIKEGISDLLKPKSEDEIVNGITNELLLILNNGKSASFYKYWGSNTHKFGVFESSWSITEYLDKNKNVYGPGLYVLTSSKAQKNPLENKFTYKKICGLYFYPISVKNLKEALNELVKETYIKKELGDGFHVMYFSKISFRRVKSK